MIAHLDISPLSLGCALIGMLYKGIDPDIAHAALHAARDAGVPLFDHAPFEGAGLSEARAGDDDCCGL